MREIRIGIRTWYLFLFPVLWLVLILFSDSSGDPLFDIFLMVFVGLATAVAVSSLYWGRNWIVLTPWELRFRPVGSVDWKDVESIVVFGLEGAKLVGIKVGEGSIRFRWLGKLHAWHSRRAYGFSILIHAQALSISVEELQNHLRKFHSVYVEGEGLLGSLQERT